MTTSSMVQGRQADSARRRQRVIKAINQAVSSGGELSVSGIARAAGLDRTFLYRHSDLLQQIHIAEVDASSSDRKGSAVSKTSLQADLANAHGQIARQQSRIRQLDERLSEQLGSKRGANPASAPPSTSTSSSTASPSSNNWSPNSEANSTTASKNSTPHVPRTVS
jgi:hypothetical protein